MDKRRLAAQINLLAIDVESSMERGAYTREFAKYSGKIKGIEKALKGIRRHLGDDGLQKYVGDVDEIDDMVSRLAMHIEIHFDEL